MKVVRLLVCACIPTILLGQGAPPPLASASAGVTGAFFALMVADLEASARWYSEKLDLKVVMHSPKQGGTAVKLLEGSGLIVELIEQDGALALPAAPPTIKAGPYVLGISKVGAIVRDFDQTVSTLRAHHVDIAYGPYPARANVRANVIIRDNAGNLIQFFGDYSSDHK